MTYPKIPLAQNLIQICKAQGVQHIVISPGSRNAPLTLGFTQDTYFKCYSVADERCAAFFALGMIQQLQQPVAVICTSGSAVLNFYPAVAEAFYSQLPLIVISADRPASKIDIGDGQTIRQVNVLASHTVFNANLQEDVSEENDLLINQAILTAISQKGPVHINAPFEEPLYEMVEELSVHPKIVPLEKSVSKIDSTEINRLSQLWNTSSKKLVLIGSLTPNELDNSIIENWANDPSVVVLTEVTSNIYHPNFIASIDTLITPFENQDFDNFKPEILLTLGGMVVSKRVKAFLRKFAPKEHWHIDSLRAYDTYGHLTQWIKQKPNDFLLEFNQKIEPKKSSYQSEILGIQKKRLEKGRLFFKNAPYSDFLVYGNLIQELPNNYLVHISNSAGIRYSQLFEFNPTTEIWCNRGTSGIDGSSSTAVGASVQSAKPTVLITGDISFFYDSNALWNNYIPENFKIILVNNSGGGIFRILPGHQENPSFNTYFETSHHLTAKHLAKMYNFGYSTIENENKLQEKLKSFYQSEGKQLLEIFTPEKKNDLVLKEYFKSLS